MKISEFAKAAGCQAVTVRFYESKGLLGNPGRTPGNYRVYGEQDLERLLFIRNCRALGLAMQEIARLIELQDKPDLLCDDVNQLIDDHLFDVERQMQALQTLQSQLAGLRRRCDAQRRSSECGVLHALAVEQFKSGNTNRAKRQ
ncbi:Cd(II)/Pb(II)-responsive transcriptional regulator [Oxalicibacterium solurbis]|uniref:MerR family transcriptional regulator n=1 Tax=Oxalicibacterium solurbis TaxID=69280 RepID=A0A8J3B5S7_9BURK|nr:Cd(II)/Pb(II)-responsive transcriptional regulator [Oxalicibacterium solurbis]GGI55643.1 MerR family transcriptional regulator [Oxalicibacterium solurbis]